MELWRILEEEALGRRACEIGLPALVESVEKASRIYAWCSRTGDLEVCGRMRRALGEAGRGLARLRILKALRGAEPGGSFDGEVFELVGRLVSAVGRILEGYPIDPYGRVPVQILEGLEHGGALLGRGRIYMIPLDRALALLATGRARLVSLSPPESPSSAPQTS